MAAESRAYEIFLCYEAYFCKRIEVEAANILAACQLAMKQACDDSEWKDTFESSDHWIESIGDGEQIVPEPYSSAAIRCGGAVLIAYRLREALRSLIAACEEHPSTLAVISRDLKKAKELLMDIPESIGD